MISGGIGPLGGAAASTLTPLVAGLISSGVGGVVSGIGSGIAADEEASARRDAAAEAARGPVRGGTARAGNKGAIGLTPVSTLEKIGQASIPMEAPTMGNAPNMPVNMQSLYQPKAFGQGFANNYRLRNQQF